MIILETKKLTKSYPMSGGKQLSVLEDINIQVSEGELLSILGPSGAGKSTLLRILVGLTTPSKGEVLHYGIPLAKARPKYAMVFQSFALFPWLTVLENVEMGLKSQNMPDNDARDKSINPKNAVTTNINAKKVLLLN